LHDFKFVLQAPLRPSATLNYQAATRFIEHSLPDLTRGRWFFTNYNVHDSLPFLALSIEELLILCRPKAEFEKY
jgi:hypothetical protein